MLTYCMLITRYGLTCVLSSIVQRQINQKSIMTVLETIGVLVTGGPENYVYQE